MNSFVQLQYITKSEQYISLHDSRKINRILNHTKLTGLVNRIAVAQNLTYQFITTIKATGRVEVEHDH